MTEGSTQNRLRILMFTTKFWPTVGGAQVHVLELARALTRLKTDVFVVAERIPSDLPLREQIDGVAVFRAPLRAHKFLLFPAYVMVSIMVQWKIRANIIHAHFALPCGLVGIIVSRLFRIPLVLTVHGIDIIKAPSVRYGIRLNPVLDRLVKHVLSEPKRIIACSRFMGRLVLRCGVNNTRVSIIPNGTSDPERKNRVSKVSSKRRIREQLGLPLDSCLLLTPRRMVEKNGIEHVIRAISILRKRSLNYHALIVGDGPLRTTLENLATQLKATPSISFLGEVEEKRLEQLYLASDIVLLPSVVEAFGLPVVEAMAYRRPVITFDSGGPVEIVAREKTGVIVEKMTASALAETIEDLSANRSLLRRLQYNSSRSAPAYDWLAIAERTMHVYGVTLGHRMPHNHSLTY
jgi:glycosyltransferase involved in cell wall biosynthesis